MAMNGDTLGIAMYDAIAALPGVTVDDVTAAKDIWKALAGALVTHLTTNAVIPAGIAVAVTPATGIGTTTGPGAIT